MHDLLCCVTILAALSQTGRPGDIGLKIAHKRDRYPEYDYLYPQYRYKPYSYALYGYQTNQDCNRGYYRTYIHYLLTFRRLWNQTDYPRYRTDSRNEKLWRSYGTYKYKGKVKATKPKKKGSCCWEFEALTRRKSSTLEKGRMRIEYRQLDSKQRNSLHAAFNALKLYGIGPYDFFVSRHNGAFAPFAHSGAAFLPWHREFLFRLENALYKAGYKGPGLPYWDSTLDQALPTPSDSAIWTDEYLGNIDGVVTSGFASGWRSIRTCYHIGSRLERNGASGWLGNCLLMSDDDIDYVYSKRCFRDIVCNNDCKFENDHAAVHNFVGGHMADPSCAPSDPVFFLHHAFIDCIWEFFRQNHQESNIYKEYPNPANGDDIGSAGHEFNQPMLPFGPALLNGHGIEKFYEAYYECKARPMKCSDHVHCSSILLWCHNGRCTGKVKEGGNCAGLPSVACYCLDGRPLCSHNRCFC